MHGGALPLRAPDFTDLTNHSDFQYTAPIIGCMVRTHLFFKVEVEHDEDESPGKIGEEIGRQLRKLYVVRSVELSSILTEPE